MPTALNSISTIFGTISVDPLEETRRDDQHGRCRNIDEHFTKLPNEFGTIEIAECTARYLARGAINRPMLKMAAPNNAATLMMVTVRADLLPCQPATSSNARSASERPISVAVK